MTADLVEHLLQRLEAGDAVPPAELTSLADGPDILPLGMLADALRRRLHDGTVTYVRVLAVPAAVAELSGVPAGTGEVRLVGRPSSLDEAVRAVARVRRAASAVPLTGFSGAVLVDLAGEAGVSLATALDELRASGLDALGEVALDEGSGAEGILEASASVGLAPVRCTIGRRPSDRLAVFRRAQALQDRFGTVRAIAPLASEPDVARPTTGYDDVKSVALARLAAPGIATVQVDWARYGPKLAQVALTFGADDLDAVTPVDDAPDGRRRAPLEEVRRNIVAAGFVPVERDGRFRTRS
jgi:aminodeoxyfutalosine synthase